MIQKDVHTWGKNLIKKPDPPEVQFNMGDNTLAEVNEVVKKARAKSAPGPSGLSYKVYKKCSKFQRRLWKLFCALWRKGSYPDCWLIAEGY